MINLKLRSMIFLCLIGLLSGACSDITIETGENYEIAELPDGSMVYLNHNSSITYSRGIDSRRVRLKGEAYFKVEEGKTPFVVTAGHGKIVVKGTEFNVRSDNKEIEVEVEEGSVELKTKYHKKTVERGELARFREGDKEIRKSKAQFNFKLWMADLQIEVKKLEKELKSSSKELQESSKALGKDIKKEIKRINIKISRD